jgi:hypothetical protein
VLSFEEYRTSSVAFSTYTQVGTITIVKAPVPAQYAAKPSDPVRRPLMLACLIATCIGQPPLVPNPVPPPAVCCWDCWKPGPTKESAATPWLWQSSTDPLNEWIPVVAAVPSVDKWVGRQTAWILSKLPRAGGGGGGGAGAPAVPDVASWFVQPPCPTTAARVGVGRYLDCAQPPLAAMPAPAVDRWVARNADPTIGARATPWSWPNKGEIITASIPAPVVSQWYTPPPGPTPATRAKPQFYPSWGGFFTAALPAPTIDRWVAQPPGPTAEAAATPWRWQTSTEPVGAWATPVDTRAYPDRWQSPIPGPVPPERALPHLYQDRGQPPIATLPAPIVSCWVAQQPGPTPEKLATPWQWQSATEPVSAWQASVDIRAYPDRWQAPIPGPTPAKRATPHLWPDKGEYQAASLPIPVITCWVAKPADPLPRNRATPWLYQTSTEPLVRWFKSVDLAYADHWSCPQPVPIIAKRLPTALIPHSSQGQIIPPVPLLTNWVGQLPEPQQPGRACPWYDVWPQFGPDFGFTPISIPPPAGFNLSQQVAPAIFLGRLVSVRRPGRVQPSQNIGTVERTP